MLPPVWPLPRSLATTSGISVDFSSSPYLDVSVQAVPFQLLWIHKRMTEYCSAGFPHSDILGSMAALASPGLFVDRYVLHRLPMPRHSPCALISLTFVRIMCPLVLVNFSTRLYCSVYPFQKINWIFVTLSRCFHFTFTCIQFSRYMVGLRGLEPPTSRLSGVRSNHLSYKPMFLIHSRESLKRIGIRFSQTCGGDKRDRTADPLLAKQVLSQLSYTPISRVENP